MSVEYAYTPNEISYRKEIEKIERELKSLFNVEEISQKQSQIKAIEERLHTEQEVFVDSVNMVADILKNLICQLPIT